MDNSLNRREFLTLSSSLMLLTIPVAANPPRPLDQPATSQKRWGLLIDTSKCSSGCDACVNACHIDNGVTGNNRPATDAQWIRKVTVKDKQTQKVTSLPLMCQHCENPPCVDVCPTTASFKRADGIVLVDKQLCIGCRYCMMACPYKARSFIHEKVENQKPHVPRGMGTVEACNLCVKRVDEGKLPACVEACKNAGHNAILFGDLRDKNSEISQRLQKVSSTALRADMGLNPGVRYENL